MGKWSHFIFSEALAKFRMKKYRGSSQDFSASENFAEWVQRMGVNLQQPVMPVCFGGNFAVRRRNIFRMDPAVWARLEKSLARSDNMEEGHFAERLWANMLWPLEAKTSQALYRQSIKHEKTNGLGMLGVIQGCREPRNCAKN